MNRPPLVLPENFVVATRDSGYRSTAYSVAEFIDNALQAAATRITIDVRPGRDGQYPAEILVCDDGEGMDARVLANALPFGGTSRFDDRTSLGRYGMGLPNGAMSRCRRVTVYTWRNKSEVLMAYLDLDEILARRHRTLSPVKKVARPPFLPKTSHGTAVHLTQCDRLEYKRISALIDRLRREMGRIYRRFLTHRVEIFVNGEPVTPHDPLFLDPPSGNAEARPFGDVLDYELSTPAGVGNVTVRFAELPIERWHHLPSERKRELGVTSGSCVYVMRADREIDHGWFFMGGKRRENYDDWWRCEVSFDPTLDELFGITHAKQQIRPTDALLQVLVPDLEPIGRALNSRVRKRFELAKLRTPLGAAESQAARASEFLSPLPRRRDRVPEEVRESLRESDHQAPYRICIAELQTTAAFEVVVRDRALVLLINARHPLYKDLYGPLAASDSERDQDIAKHVALAVLAAAHAEAEVVNKVDRGRLQRFRQEWADVLATFYTTGR